MKLDRLKFLCYSFLMLCVFDLFMTTYVTVQSPEYEANPIAKNIMEQLGNFGLVVYKFILSVIVIMCVYIINKKRPRMAFYIILFAVIVNVAVFFYHLWIFAYFSWYEPMVLRELAEPSVFF